MNLLEPAPTRIDLNFHLYDTPVRVSGWFWVVPGLIAIPFVSVSGIGYFFIMAGCFFGSILLHEFGHVIAGRRFGAESYVVLNGIGGIAVGCAEVAERWQRVVVYAAGPVAQLLLGGFLWLTSDRILQLVEPGTHRLGPLHGRRTRGPPAVAEAGVAVALPHGSDGRRTGPIEGTAPFEGTPRLR